MESKKVRGMGRVHGKDAKDHPFVKYIDNVCSVSGKTNMEICEDLGWTTPSGMSNIRNGRQHLPLLKVEAFAKSVYVDPAFVMRKAIDAYYPEISSIMFRYFGGMLSKQEQDVAHAVKEANPDDYLIRPETIAEIKKLIAKDVASKIPFKPEPEPLPRASRASR